MSNIPGIGHVIKYSYLLWNEHRKGKVEGLKERPCSVLLNRKDENGKTVLFVLPITHTPPEDPEFGIEIPAATKRRLGTQTPQLTPTQRAFSLRCLSFVLFACYHP